MRKGVESVIPAGIVSVRHLATIFRSEGFFKGYWFDNFDWRFGIVSAIRATG